jgi:hypothetical protein
VLAILQDRPPNPQKDRCSRQDVPRRRKGRPNGRHLALRHMIGLKIKILMSERHHDWRKTRGSDIKSVSSYVETSISCQAGKPFIVVLFNRVRSRSIGGSFMENDSCILF